MEREGPQVFLHAFPYVHWMGVDVEGLEPVRTIKGAGGDGIIGGRVHVEPPEKVGGAEPAPLPGKFFPDLFASD